MKDWRYFFPIKSIIKNDKAVRISKLKTKTRA